MEELVADWLKSEAHQGTFSGWDFSYLDGKWTQEALPWEYQRIVKDYLSPEKTLLDMGTGGGELLAQFHHPPEKTSVTEGW